MTYRTKDIENLHIIGHEELPAPAALKAELALEGRGAGNGADWPSGSKGDSRS